MCASTVIDICLQLVPNGDLLTQKLCVSLLRILACEEQAREQIRIYDGVPALVRFINFFVSKFIAVLVYFEMMRVLVGPQFNR